MQALDSLAHGYYWLAVLRDENSLQLLGSPCKIQSQTAVLVAQAYEMAGVRLARDNRLSNWWRIEFFPWWRHRSGRHLLR